MRLIDADALDHAFTMLRFDEQGNVAHFDDRKNWCLHGSEVEKLIADAPTVEADILTVQEKHDLANIHKILDGSEQEIGNSDYVIWRSDAYGKHVAEQMSEMDHVVYCENCCFWEKFEDCNTSGYCRSDYYGIYNGMQTDHDWYCAEGVKKEKVEKECYYFCLTGALPTRQECQKFGGCKKCSYYLPVNPTNDEKENEEE